MKSTSLLIMAAAGVIAVMSSCSSENDDPVAVADDNVIRFTAASRLPQERANSDITTGNLSQFFVYGYLASNGSAYMSDVEVNKTGANLWEYSPVKYWPSGDALDFYAYAPAGMLPPGVTPKDNVAFTNSGMKDFIYAVSPGMRQPAAGSDAQVKFNFRHALAKVSVMLSSQETKLDVRVNNVTIVGAFQYGEFTFPSSSTAGAQEPSSVGTWSKLSGRGASILHMAQRQDEVLHLTTEAIDADTDGNGASFFIPQELPFVQGGDFANEVYLVLNCAIYDRATGAKVWPNENTPDVNLPNGGISGEGYIYLSLKGSDFSAWQAGNYYIYNVEINGHPDMSQIEFGTPTVDSFVTVTSQLEP